MVIVSKGVVIKGDNVKGVVIVDKVCWEYAENNIRSHQILGDNSTYA